MNKDYSSNIYKCPTVYKKLKKPVCLVLTLLTCIAVTCQSPPSENTLENFQYQVQVLDSISNQPVERATITIVIGANPPFEEPTDNRGFAIFTFPTNLSGLTGKMTISKDGYASKDLSVLLQATTGTYTITSQQNPLLPGVTPPTSVTSTSENLLPLESSQLPVFTCIIFDYPSHYPAIQIVQNELDKQNGFQLNLVIWGVSEVPYVYEEYADVLQRGEIDCALDVLDGPAVYGNYGTITAIIGESAGADQVWVKEGIQTINEFAGKRIALVPESIAVFLTYALLDLVGLTSSDVIFVEGIGGVEFETPQEAVNAFNNGDADVVIGWGPQMSNAAQSGGRKLVDTSELRYIIDVILVSPVTLQSRPEVVQAFHRAWFKAVKQQIDNPGAAAETITAWGNNDWTKVYPGTAEADLRTQLESVAQAGYSPNLLIMQNLTILHNRLDHARKVMTNVGMSELLIPFDIDSAVDPRFVLNLQQQETEFRLEGKPQNDSFSLSGGDPLPPTSGVAWIPFSEVYQCGGTFEFLPDTTELTPASRQLLDDCVIPRLEPATSGILITGSSAWPGPPLGSYTEEQIALFAQQRAFAVATYLANHGISANQIITDFVLPPEERRGSTDEAELVKDRIVKIQLITGAR